MITDEEKKSIIEKILGEIEREQKRKELEAFEREVRESLLRVPDKKEALERLRDETEARIGTVEVWRA